MSARVSTLKEIAAKIDRAVAYRGAKPGFDENAIEAVDDIWKGVCKRLDAKPEDGSLDQARPIGLNSKRDIGHYVVVLREGTNYASTIRAIVRGVVAKVDFEIVIREAPNLPVSQTREWHVRLGEKDYSLGLVQVGITPGRHIKFDVACDGIVDELSAKLLSQVPPIVEPSSPTPQGGSVDVQDPETASFGS